LKVEYHLKKKLGIFVSYFYQDGALVLGINGSYKGGNLIEIITEKATSFNDVY